MSALFLAYIHLTKIFIAILYFSAVPWAVLDESPGVGIQGCFQLGFILLVIGLSLWHYIKVPLFKRLEIAAIAYLAATLISNIAAVLLIPHLLH